MGRVASQKFKPQVRHTCGSGEEVDATSRKPGEVDATSREPGEVDDPSREPEIHTTSATHSGIGGRG